MRYIPIVSTPCSQELEANYREQAELPAEDGVDLTALEMMYKVDLAAPAIRAALATGLPTKKRRCIQSYERLGRGFHDTGTYPSCGGLMR